MGNLGLANSTHNTLVVGAPGTGKTFELVRCAVERVNAGADPAGILVLTPSRVSATRFREDFSAAINATVSTAPTRAWSAYAFDVLRRAHAENLLPGLDFSPRLLSGPEQDVMIKELLAGHARGEGAVIMWPKDLHEALSTHGFRHEIRDLFDRMAEYGIDAGELKELAHTMNQPAWNSAATLFTEYRAVRRLRMPNAYDPSSLIHEASKVFENNPDFLAKERKRLSVVLIDDLQEASASYYRLLNILCGKAGNQLCSQPAPQVIASVCSETAVQGFRGARPDAISSLPQIIDGLATYQLSTSYRMTAPIAQSWQAIAARLPAYPAAITPRSLTQPESEHRQEALLPTGDDGALLDPTKLKSQEPSVEALTVDTPSAEAALVAQMILEEHLYQGHSYAKSAVIVRNSSDVSRIKRALANLGIPVKTAASLVPVRDEPAVRPFLDALALLLHEQSQTARAADPLEAVKTQEQAQELENVENLESAGQKARSTKSPGTGWQLGADTAISLLTSRLGGASAMEIRRLRQRLRADELRAGGTRHSDELLVQALVESNSFSARGAGSAMSRVSRVLSAGRKELQLPEANAETVLWALWEASGLAKIWHEATLLGAESAQRAHRDLDAMIGLFEAASRFTDQMPGASAAQFYDYIEAQDLPMDTLAVRSNTLEAVEIMTAALSSGRQWDTVYIVGIQEGTWPNTTLRGSLLNTQLLTDVLDVGSAAAQSVTGTHRAMLNRNDEFRLFSTAISRAQRRLVLCAVKSVDEAPSELLDIAAPAPEGERSNVEVRRPMTLRALIAELRQFSESQDSDPVRAQAAAQILHRLNDPQQTASIHLPGVDPSSWWGLLDLSSAGSGFSPGSPVPISPSRVESIHRSPLDWFVAAARAEAATDAVRSLGTLVHAIAEDMPEAAGFELEEELERRFGQLNLKPGWETDQLYEKARKMVRRFASYIADLPGQQRALVGVEGAFSVLIPHEVHDVLLSGRVDRLEVDSLGRFVIIDLKTGSHKPRAKDLEQHPQLATYQVALEAGAGAQMQAAMQAGSDQKPEPVTFTCLAGKSGGAYLVQIGGTTKSYSAQEQPPLLSGDNWAVELITQAAQLISDSTVQARHTSEGPFGLPCRLPDICPLCARGRQVTQSLN